jgi:hypothetical protein
VWGSAKASNLTRIQRFQSKVLHHILDTPRFVSNYTMDTELQIPNVTEIIKSINYYPVTESTVTLDDGIVLFFIM